MSEQRFKPGTRFYYTGDRANCATYGTITKYRPANKYIPKTVDVEYDDERFKGDTKTQRQVYIANFSVGPGRRFWFADEWDNRHN